jgi:hypothetical protein
VEEDGTIKQFINESQMEFMIYQKEREKHFASDLKTTNKGSGTQKLTKLLGTPRITTKSIFSLIILLFCILPISFSGLSFSIQIYARYSVDIATAWTAGVQFPVQARLSSTASRPALDPIQAPIQQISWPILKEEAGA